MTFLLKFPEEIIYIERNEYMKSGYFSVFETAFLSKASRGHLKIYKIERQQWEESFTFSVHLSFSHFYK